METITYEADEIQVEFVQTCLDGIATFIYERPRFNQCYNFVCNCTYRYQYMLVFPRKFWKLEFFRQKFDTPKTSIMSGVPILITRIAQSKYKICRIFLSKTVQFIKIKHCLSRILTILESIVSTLPSGFLK